MKKIIYFLSHPIQYQSPLLQLLAKENEMELTVCYYAKHTLGGIDQQFGEKVMWDVPLLEGYNYKFLKNYSLKPAVSGSFLGAINFGIFLELILNRPSYVLVNGWAYFSDWLVLLSCKLLGIRVMIRGDNPLKHEHKKSVLGKIKRRLLNLFVTKFLYVGVENKKYYEDFINNPRDRLFFTPHSIDNCRFENEYRNLLKDRESNRNEKGISKSDVVILFVGKYIGKKHPMDLLMAFQRILHKDIKLVMVGEGEKRLEMERFIYNNNLDEQVMLTGFVNQREITRYYSIADLFVLPSDKGETWGLVLNEAMNFHLPLIVSDMVGSSDDLVHKGKNGYTYTCGDIESLSDYLITLVRDKSSRKKMGGESAELVKEYSYERVIEGLKRAIK